MSSIKSFIKNTFIYGIAAVLPKAINVFLVGLHTKTLDNAAQFNVNTEFYVWAAYFNVLLTFGMETTFFKFYNSEKNKNQVLSTSFYSVAFVSFLVIGSLYGFADALSQLFGFKESLHFKVLLGILLFDNLTVIPFAYLRVNNKAFNYTLYRIVNISIYAFLNILFLYLIPNIQETVFQEWFTTQSKVGYIFLANFIASAITLILVLPMFFKFDFKFDFDLFKKMMRYGWPILIAGISFVTNENLDKLVLPRFIDPSTAGAYAGCYKLGVFMSLFIMAFKLGAEPFFFNVAKSSNAQLKYAMISKWFTILGAFIILVIVAYIDLFAGILLKKDEYLNALAIVPIILIANLMLGIYNNLSVWYKVIDKTRYAMYFSILGGVLTVGGLMILVPILGFMGAAWVTFISYGAMMIGSYIYGQKHYPVPYESAKILGILIFTIGISFLSFYFFRKNYWLNTLMLVSFLTGIVYLERNFINQTILKRKS